MGSSGINTGVPCQGQGRPRERDLRQDQGYQNRLRTRVLKNLTLARLSLISAGCSIHVLPTWRAAKRLNTITLPTCTTNGKPSAPLEQSKLKHGVQTVPSALLFPPHPPSRR